MAEETASPSSIPIRYEEKKKGASGGSRPSPPFVREKPPASIEGRRVETVAAGGEPSRETEMMGAAGIPPRPPGGSGNGEADPPADPGLRALQELRVDLDHPDEDMRRLADAFREALSAGTDRDRIALLDQGMAALVRYRPATAKTVHELMTSETLPAAARYYAYLVREGDRAALEEELIAQATEDAETRRRADAVVALGPCPRGKALETVGGALLDPELAVRQAAAEVLGDAVQADPSFREGLAADKLLSLALEVESDGTQRNALLGLLVSE